MVWVERVAGEQTRRDAPLSRLVARDEISRGRVWGITVFTLKPPRTTFDGAELLARVTLTDGLRVDVVRSVPTTERLACVGVFVGGRSAAVDALLRYRVHESDSVRSSARRKSNTILFPSVAYISMIRTGVFPPTAYVTARFRAV